MNSKEVMAFIYKIRYPLSLVLFLIAVKITDDFSGSYIYRWGNFPREWSGIPGILTSHFIHGSWGHLASNLIPVCVLTSVLVLFYPKVAGQSFFTIMMGTGVMVWLFARPSYHIGASGIVYGLISFIFWLGIFKKNKKSVVLSLIILILYSGSAEGLFPAERGVSWEIHLFGALVGWVVAFVFRGVVEEDEKEYDTPPSWAHEPRVVSYFLPRDVFEKTKKQRHEEYLEAQRLEREAREKAIFHYIYRPENPPSSET